MGTYLRTVNQIWELRQAAREGNTQMAHELQEKILDHVQNLEAAISKAVIRGNLCLGTDKSISAICEELIAECEAELPAIKDELNKRFAEGAKKEAA